MSVEPGRVIWAWSAKRQYEVLSDGEQQQVNRGLRSLATGAVREEDVNPYAFYRRPFVARARSLSASSFLRVIFVSRQLQSRAYPEHIIVGLRRAAPPGYHYVRGYLRRDSNGAALTATNVAVRIAGRRRAHLHTEWAAVLMGSPQDGVAFSPRRQLHMAVGFLLAALRMRIRDVARPAWRPVDWLLRTSSRTNVFITAAVGAQTIYIVGDGGLSALVVEVWEPCGIAGASLYVLARWLRRVRGIELAASESEGTEE